MKKDTLCLYYRECQYSGVSFCNIKYELLFNTDTYLLIVPSVDVII